MGLKILKTLALTTVLWIILVGPLMLASYLEATGRIPDLSQTIAHNPIYLLTLVPGVLLLIKRAITGKFI